MEDLQQIPWSLVLIASEILLGGVFGIVLLLMKFPAARHLGKLILAYSFILLSLLQPSFPVSKWQVIGLIALFLFLYVRAFFSQKNRMSFVHLVPVVLSVCLFMTPPLIDRITALVIVITYGVMSLREIESETKQRGIQWFVNPGSRLAWFRNFITINGIGLLIMLSGIANLDFMAGLVLVVIVFIVYQAFKESEFLTPIPIGNKYQKSTLTPEIKAAVLNKIEGVMEQEFYLRDDASLSNLAKELGVTTHHLSQVLNESLKIGFQDLIARYRIRKACQLLKDEQHRDVKIENIAAMVGYNSKSSFNAAFKRRTGLTPSDYRDKKDVRTYWETPLSERERPLYEDHKFHLSHVFNIQMNKDMIRFSLRNLRKNKLHSALNIMGLAVGLSACITIACYVHYELSYDRHHPEAESIYRVALNRVYPDYAKEWALTAPVMGPVITDEIPEIQHYTRLQYDDFMFGREGDRLEKQRITAVDSGFFDVFDAKVISGSINKEFFEKKDGVILTQSAVKKYFGNEEEPVGKLMSLQIPDKEQSTLVSVTAVIADPLPNSHFDYEILSVIDLMPFPDWFFATWGTWGVYTYIKVHPETDPVLLREKINAIAEANQAAGSDDYDAWRGAGNQYDYFLQPMTDIHLHSNLASEFEANSSEMFVYFFALVGGFILLMAIVNFVNLATARASYRTLEVGIRKSVGASRRDLMVQFLLESTLISFIAMVIALPLTQLFLPYFNQVIGKSISLQVFGTPLGIIILIATPVLLGILSGFYPALYLSNFSPAAVFQKLIVKRGRESLRHLLVIGQFIIAILLIAGTITVFRQMHYLTNKPLGFDKDQLIMIEKLPFIGEKIDVFKQEALQSAGVNGVSITNFPLDDIRSGSTISITDDDKGWVNTTFLTIDEDFLSTMGVKLIAGRNFRSDEMGERTDDGKEKILLNETAVRALGIEPEDAVGKLVYEAAGFDAIIVGVVEDFNFMSLHKPVEPMQLSNAVINSPFRAATIRLNPRNMDESLASVEEIWGKLAPDKVFEFEYMDESMAQYYEAERLTSKLFIMFSGLGIFVCCLGLFGLMGYVVEQRSKEVGIRKVMGARNGNIIFLLSKDYVRLVLISSLVAIPIAWWGLSKWLDGFAYRIDSSIWMFLLAGVLVTAVSWITVALYALQAAKANPVHSLRNE
ncbi:FtsX-like permease family protein [Ekhidna sp.]|uniref:FtsX-like permease family protein n=1 Tax=Ekhidna sp. TaxID=2608089 RepID=UPI003B5B79EF